MCPGLPCASGHPGDIQSRRRSGRINETGRETPMSPYANGAAPRLMRARPVRILLAEQDAGLASALRCELEQIGFQVDWVANGRSAEHMLANESFDVVLLGWELPSRSGAELLAGLRAARNAAPVLVIAARDTLEERVAGLDGGADDFLSRPLPAAELIARVNAVLRRSQAREDRCLCCGPLVYNQDTLLFHLDGAHLALTPREHAVLAALI